MSEINEKDKHYLNDNGQELIDIMYVNFGREATYHFCLLNAVKYLFRCQKKHETPTDDLRKAEWYINKAKLMSA